MGEEDNLFRAAAIDAARKARDNAMYAARRLRWAITGEESLTEKRRTARLVDSIKADRCKTPR